MVLWKLGFVLLHGSSGSCINNLVLIAARDVGWQTGGTVSVGSGWPFSKVISAGTRTIKHVSYLFICVGFVMLSLSVSSARTFFAMQKRFTSLSLIFEQLTPHTIAQRSKTQKSTRKNNATTSYTTDAPITQNVCLLLHSLWQISFICLHYLSDCISFLRTTPCPVMSRAL